MALATLRYWPTKDRAWLIAALDELAEEERDGKVIISAGAGDVNSQASVQASIADRKRRLLHDLSILDPDGGWGAHVLPTMTVGVLRPTE